MRISDGWSRALFLFSKTIKMIKKKTMVLLCFMYCMLVGIQAETGKNLVIQKTNGTKTTFLLSESPELTFANRSLKVTVGERNTTFQIDDVAQYYFETASTVPKTFDYKTVQDVTVTMQVINETSKTAQVGSGERAIAQTTSGLLAVPDKANGYTVTGIGESAFSGCSKLTAIVLAKTVVSIGSYAFQNCTSLQYILLRETSLVSNIGTNLAYNNGKATTIPVYVRKNLLSSFKNNSEWKKYQLNGYTPGDADNDGVIDVVDIQQDVNRILERTSAGFNVGGGDADEDNVVDVNDIQTIINKILGRSNARMAERGESEGTSDDVLQLEQIANDRLSLKLGNSSRYSAFQFKLHLPQAAKVSGVKLSESLQNTHKVSFNRLDDGSYQFVCFSDYGEPIVDEQILTLQLSGSDDEIYADDIFFSTLDAQKVHFGRLPVGMAQGISSPAGQNLNISYSDNDFIHIDGISPHASVKLFAIDGKNHSTNVTVNGDHAIISLATLPQGVYIISVNNQQIKVIRK